MATRTSWTRPWAVLLLVVASFPARAEGQIVGETPATPSCNYCNGTECVDKTNCPYVCTDKCPAGFYSVRVIKSNKCASLLSQMDELPVPEIKVNPTASPAEDTSTNYSSKTVRPTSTTPAPLLLVCKRCSLDGCLRCVDDAKCETCAEGYFLSNSSHTCSRPAVEESLGAGPIVGIVIACLCLVGVAGVGVWLIFRRFHRSRDLNQDVQKVNPEAEERHAWRRSCESVDVAGLGIAPQLPGFDPNDNGDVDKSYDALVKGDECDQSSYAPLNQSQENLYTNTAATPADNIYGNVQQIGAAETQANSGFSHKNPPLAGISQESGDFYEDVAVRSSAENSLGDIGSDNSHLPIQIVEDDSEEFYANCNVDNTNDIYQNM